MIRLVCAVCGSETRGRQWHNRDTGYGLCADCVPWLKARGMPTEEMERCYGREGEHYFTAPADAARSEVVQ